MIFLRYFVIDGETCETPRDENGQLDVRNGQVYDLGGQVIEEDGRVLKEVSYINRDVFFGMPQSMEECYYAEKIPQYQEEINKKQRVVVNTWQLWKNIYQICKKYHVDYIVAHNARFDINTLNATMRYQTKSKKRYFFPYGTKVLDTMRLAGIYICKNEDYVNFCKINGYMTNHRTPRPQKNAQVLYRYLTKDNDFVESHTGLEDVKIEKEILLECLRRGAMIETD